MQLLDREIAVLNRSAHPRVDARPGQLGGFAVTVTKDLAGTDPAGLVIRLENRLTGLEALKAKTLSEIERMRAEMARAREDGSKAFPQAGKFAAARERAYEIERQLEKAAKPQQRDQPQQTAGGPQPQTGPVRWPGPGLRHEEHGRSQVGSCAHERRRQVQRLDCGGRRRWGRSLSCLPVTTATVGRSCRLARIQMSGGMSTVGISDAADDHVHGGVVLRMQVPVPVGLDLMVHGWAKRHREAPTPAAPDQRRPNLQPTLTGMNTFRLIWPGCRPPVS